MKQTALHTRHHLGHGEVLRVEGLAGPLILDGLLIVGDHVQELVAVLELLDVLGQRARVNAFQLRLAEVIPIVTQHDHGRHLLCAGPRQVLGVPGDGLAHCAVIPVVDRLGVLAGDVGLEAELVEEDVEALVLALGQADEAVVERERAVAELLEDDLQDDDIVKGRALLEQVHGTQEGIGVGHQVVALGEHAGAGGGLGEERRGDCGQLVFCSVREDSLLKDSLLTSASGIAGRCLEAGLAEPRRARNVLAQVDLANNLLHLAAFCRSHVHLA